MVAVLPTSPATAYSGTPDNAEAEFFNALNATRQGQGLAPLEWNGSLAAYARNWSAQMGAAQSLVHSPYLAEETGAAVAGWSNAGENIGYGGSTGSLHDAFWNSIPHRNNILGGFNQVGIGVVVVNGAIWVTFRFAYGPIAKPPDTTPPSVISAALESTQSAATFTVGWWGTDNDAGIAYFNVDVLDGGSWIRWLSGVPAKYRAGLDAAGDFPFFGTPGRSYSFRAHAVDNAYNTSGFSQTISTTVSAGAARPMPFSSAYAMGRDGDVSALSSVPVSAPYWTNNAVRGFVARPQGGGYQVDYSGGIRPVGVAPNVAQYAYFGGWDIVRSIALNPDGRGGYVLDGFGGIWPFGNAAPVTTAGYFSGWDIVRDIVLLPTSTASRPAGYTMDAWGGLHAFGGAPIATQGPYWHGWDIARDVVANPNGPGGWVLDGWGGVHPFGGAPYVQTSRAWPGWDIARGLTMYSGPNGLAGYVLDGWGGVSPINNAPAVTPTRSWAFKDQAKFLTLVP